MNCCKKCSHVDFWGICCVDSSCQCHQKPQTLNNALDKMEAALDKLEKPHDNETHTACQNRLDKEGGKATCCYCRPHTDCNLNSQKPQSWDNEWSAKLFNASADKQIKFIAEQIREAEERGKDLVYKSDGLKQVVNEAKAKARKEGANEVIQEAVKWAGDLVIQDITIKEFEQQLKSKFGREI